MNAFHRIPATKRAVTQKEATPVPVGLVTCSNNGTASVSETDSKLGSVQNGRYSANDIIKCSCSNKKCILISISPNFVPKNSIDN